MASAARAGLSATGVVGVRMALEPGEGRAAVPVRSALLGSVLAVALVVTTLTFGTVSRRWSRTRRSTGGTGPTSSTRSGPAAARSRQVALDDAQARQGRRGIFRSVLQRPAGGRPGGPVPPGERRGAGDATHPHRTWVPGERRHRARRGHDGAAAQAARRVRHRLLRQPSDGAVYIPPRRLRIVGTATFPAIGFASTVSDHTSMGTGVLIPFQVLPKSFVAAIDSGPDPALVGPNLVLVRIRTGVPPAAALASLHAIVAATDRAFAAAPGGSAGNAIVVQGVQRPAEIVNYKTIGLTPAFLVTGLVLGAVAALT